MRRWLAGVCCLIAVGWSSDTLACQCARKWRADLEEDLRVEKDNTSAVYVAEVLSIEWDTYPGKTVLLVREAYKGERREGEQFGLPNTGTAACSYDFTVGETYLVYADAEPPYVHLCSRTKRFRPDDPEIRWLRTGQLPVRPVALQRGRRRDQRVEWLPVEDLADTRCDWTDLMRPICKLTETRHPRPPQGTSGPVLRCLPSVKDESRQDCQIVQPG